jgi:hypothetical protein
MWPPRWCAGKGAELGLRIEAVDNLQSSLSLWYLAPDVLGLTLDGGCDFDPDSFRNTGTAEGGRSCCLPIRALRHRTSVRCLYAGSAGCFAATKSGKRDG